MQKQWARGHQIMHGLSGPLLLDTVLPNVNHAGQCYVELLVFLLQVVTHVVEVMHLLQHCLPRPPKVFFSVPLAKGLQNTQ